MTSDEASEPGQSAVQFPGGDILDGIPLNAAVIDADGTIVDSNDAWSTFGNFEGMTQPTDTIGVNYLTICGDAEDDPFAIEAARGIRAVLDGERESFELTYPCHSPEKKRWFRMHTGRFERDGTRYAVVTHENITEAVTSNIRLQQRAEELEELVRIISHDLRNPMAIADGYLEVLSEVTDHDAVDKIDSALERADAIIEDTLTLMRLDTAELTRESVDLAAVAREAWNGVDVADATLEIGDSMTLSAHRGLLTQVFENLFRNAVQHGGATVTVTVGTTGTGFFVADDGPGFDPDTREELFQPGVTTSPDGTGFGLSIVKRCAERHGWEVVAGDADGGGARIEFLTHPELPDPPDQLVVQ